MQKYQAPVQAGTRVVLGVAGVSFLVPPLRPVARWTAIPMLVASLPEAVNQVRHPEQMREAGVPPQLTPVRVAVQCLVIAAVWRATSPM